MNYTSPIVTFFNRIESATNYLPIQFEISDNPTIFFDAYELIKKEIDSFVSLNNNWDGYGGIPVINEIGEKSKLLITFLNDSLIDRISDIFPNSHGTLTIEWGNKMGEKLSLEIGGNNYSYFVKHNNKEPKLENGEDVISDIKKITEDLGELLRNDIPKLILP